MTRDEDKAFSVTNGDYKVSTDQRLLNMDIIHGYLEQSYWSPGIPRGVLEQAITHSLCFGVYYIVPTGIQQRNQPQQLQQVGFARLVTDYATFAYLADVFILLAHRGKGLSKWLMDCIFDKYPEMHKIRNFMLLTRDAHGLYEKYGFSNPDEPQKVMMKRQTMEWYNPDMAES